MNDFSNKGYSWIESLYGSITDDNIYIYACYLDTRIMLCKSHPFGEILFYWCLYVEPYSLEPNNFVLWADLIQYTELTAKGFPLWR